MYVNDDMLSKLNLNIPLANFEGFDPRLRRQIKGVIIYYLLSIDHEQRDKGF